MDWIELDLREEKTSKKTSNQKGSMRVLQIESDHYAFCVDGTSLKPQRMLSQCVGCLGNVSSIVVLFEHGYVLAKEIGIHSS